MSEKDLSGLSTNVGTNLSTMPYHLKKVPPNSGIRAYRLDDVYRINPFINGQPSYHLILEYLKNLSIPPASTLSSSVFTFDENPDKSLFLSKKLKQMGEDNFKILFSITWNINNDLWVSKAALEHKETKEIFLVTASSRDFYEHDHTGGKLPSRNYSDKYKNNNDYVIYGMQMDAPLFFWKKLKDILNPSIPAYRLYIIKSNIIKRYWRKYLLMKKVKEGSELYRKLCNFINAQ